MNIKTYLTCLIEEKGRDLDEMILTEEGQFGLTWQHLIDFIAQTDRKTIEEIRKTLVMIDFKNGDVFHFLTYCARGMVQALGLACMPPQPIEEKPTLFVVRATIPNSKTFDSSPMSEALAKKHAENMEYCRFQNVQILPAE